MIDGMNAKTLRDFLEESESRFFFFYSEIHLVSLNMQA